MSALAAGIAVLTGFGAGIGQGIMTGKATEAIARQPEARGSIMSALLLGLAMAETAAIYGFVISILLLYANPLTA
jgi:F-type H+-transporting ATPase subunit c